MSLQLSLFLLTLSLIILVWFKRVKYILCKSLGGKYIKPSPLVTSVAGFQTKWTKLQENGTLSTCIRIQIHFKKIWKPWLRFQFHSALEFSKINWTCNYYHSNFKDPHSNCKPLVNWKIRKLWESTRSNFLTHISLCWNLHYTTL